MSFPASRPSFSVSWCPIGWAASRQDQGIPFSANSPWNKSWIKYDQIIKSSWNHDIKSFIFRMPPYASLYIYIYIYHTIPHSDHTPTTLCPSAKKQMPMAWSWINPQEQHPEEGEKIRRRLSNAWHPPTRGGRRCLRLLRSHQAASEAKDVDIGKTWRTKKKYISFVIAHAP